MVLTVALKLISAAPSEQEQPSFTAFDCDKPMEVKVANIPIDCQHNAENLKLGSYVNISVWQEASKDTLGVLCKVERSEWLSYCGVWSHQSLIAPGTTLRPQKVSTNECKRMHREGIWTDKTGKEHKVMGEGVTFLNYVEAGSLTYYDNKISCQGARVRLEGGESLALFDMPNFYRYDILSISIFSEISLSISIFSKINKSGEKHQNILKTGKNDRIFYPFCTIISSLFL